VPETVDWIHMCVLMPLCGQMDSHTLCPCLSAFLPFSGSVRMCEQNLYIQVKVLLQSVLNKKTQSRTL